MDRLKGTAHPVLLLATMWALSWSWGSATEQSVAEQSIAEQEGNREIVVRYNAAYQIYSQMVENNNYLAALPHAKEAYHLGKIIHGEDSETYAGLSFNYGLSLLKSGLAARAYPILAEALARYENLYGKRGFELASLLDHLASAAAEMGDLRRAQQHFDRGLVIVADQVGEESPAYAKLAFHAGSVLLDEGSAEAEDYLQRSHALYRQEVGSGHRNTADVALLLGRYYLDRQDYAAAITHLESALAVFTAETPYSDKDRALRAHTGLIEAYQNIDHPEAATRHCLAIGANIPEVHEHGYRPVFSKPPVYPETARRDRREGYVLVEFDVDTNGYVRNVKAIKVEGDESFEAAALAATRQYRFAPRFVNGEPVPAENIQARLSFKLDAESG